MQERRKFRRLNTLVDVTYAKHTSSEKEKLSLTKNISQGGICLILYDEIKSSDLLDIKIYLPDDKNPIIALGKVAWVKEFIVGSETRGKRYDAGIEFIKINEKDREKIDSYVFTIIK